MSIGVRIKDNRQAVKAALEQNKKAALDAAGTTVATAAKKKTPVKTGVLRSSIAWAHSGDEPQYPRGTRHTTNAAHPEGSQAVNSGVTGPKNAVIVGTNVKYARYQHEGISPSGNLLNYTDERAERKFLESAARENARRVIRLMRQGLRGELARE